MNLDRLRIFATIADAGSFTAAADRLALTKSAVSQAVTQLERELGVQLMRRTTRALNLTESGEELLEEARELLARADALGERMRAGRARLSGLLRITSSADSAVFVAPLIAEYLAAHPDMRVEYLPSDEVLDPLKARIDLSLRISPMRDGTLKAVKLAEMALWLVASPDYLKGKTLPRKPEDLAALEWIAFAPLPSPWTREFTTRSGRRVVVRFQGRVMAGTAAGTRALCLAGAGIASSPDFMVRDDVEAGRLVHLLPEAKQPQLYLHAAWTDRVEPPARTRAFIELAKLRLRKRS
jgi:DNA-binding transcriptional LysR family regulator